MESHLLGDWVDICRGLTAYSSVFICFVRYIDCVCTYHRKIFVSLNYGYEAKFIRGDVSHSKTFGGPFIILEMLNSAP